MKSKINYFAPFEEGEYYHVYNRTNNKEPLFLDDSDRQEFLNKMQDYLGQYVYFLAYCLMGNHFHLLVAMKSRKDINTILSKTSISKLSIADKKFLSDPTSDLAYNNIFVSQFSRFFNSYSILFNKKYKRNGNLFHRPFKRVNVQDDNHLAWLIYYIHSNPQKHKVLHSFEQYPWSSFMALCSDKPTKIQKESVYYIFGGKEAFLKFHLGAKELPEHCLHLLLDDEDE